MEQSTKKKLLIGGSLVVIAGVVGYLLYKRNKDKKKSEAPPVTDGDASQTSSPPTTQTTTTTTTTSAPLKTPDEIKKFQDWMDAKHPNWVNGKNLSKGSGYGTFGPSTSKAWDSYNAEYTKPVAPVIDPKAWSNKDKVYMAKDKFALYSYPANGYSVGQVTKSVFLDKPIGVYIEPGPKGWHKIASVGYEPIGGGSMTWAVKSLYVPNWAIQKTPY